jgi:hypothetical protein
VRDDRPKGTSVTRQSLGNLPKIIWFCWLQGIDQSPYVVRKCHESWMRMNPGWEVRVLDQSAADRLTTLDFSTGNLSQLGPAHRSDLVRLSLLTTSGGVWADATCFCVQPLDAWLPSMMRSGFFAFAHPGRDRVLSNWFIASEAGNHLTSQFYTTLLDYWGNHRFRNEERERVIFVLSRLLNRSPRAALLWLSRPVRDWLAIYPYFAAHYVFHQVTTRDPRCAKIWRETPTVSADGPLRLHLSGLTSDASAELRAEIDRRAIPVYKLNWRLSEEKIRAESVLGYLLRSS